MNKLPTELHLVHGTKPDHQAITLPESVKKRIPEAEWMTNPTQWDKATFVTETAEFLFDVYGIGSDQDKHTLAMLADQIDLYVACNMQLSNNDLVISTNDGKTLAPNPIISIRNNALKLVIQLMNELGLTPRSRLNKTEGNVSDNSAVSKFLRGVKG
jgi:phage terminase small subunit